MDGLMDQIFSEDPYLSFQPAFAYTLPIQLLVSGITLTLLCVLAIHLICTSTSSQYSVLNAQCSPRELALMASHDTIPLPPSPSKLHTSILLDPHGPYIGFHPDYSDITTFG